MNELNRYLMTTNNNKMKTLYLRQKRSGNFEISNRKNFTIKINSKANLKTFWSHLRSKIIKGTYRKSQTYFGTFDELYNYVK